ncbi:MAG: amidohydrolase [Pseudomonadota bacterium]
MRRFLSAAALAAFLITPANADHDLSHIPEPGADLGEIYRFLHANPELSFQEVETSALLSAELETLGFEVTTGVGADWVRAKAMIAAGQLYENVGGYGVVGVMENGVGPSILVRTDMDALPVPEQTGKPYASKVSSIGWTGVDSPVMHACGHDVHMTSWVGAARELSARKDEWSGTLIMIAQPAEELGLGAPAMLADGLFERFPKPHANLALHVSPTIPAGEVGYAEGYALAAVDTVDIRVFGSGGHGAYPHTTKDPVVIASHIVTALQTLVSRNVDPQEPAVVTVGSIQAGAKHNIISDEAIMKLTVRTYSDEVRQILLDGIVRVANGQAATFGAPEPEVEFETDYIPSTYNDPELSQQSAAAISAAIGEDKVYTIPAVMGGEDFAHYSRTKDKIPSFIFWLGGLDAEFAASGKPLPSLHSSLFAPDADTAVPIGVDAMVAATIKAFAAYGEADQ